jgi:hypothetical protein
MMDDLDEALDRFRQDFRQDIYEAIRKATFTVGWSANYGEAWACPICGREREPQPKGDDIRSLINYCEPCACCGQMLRGRGDAALDGHLKWTKI